MRAAKFLTITAAVVATAAATLVATAPSADAQASTNVRRHGPVRVTVHKRSYLHPGTETKTYAEHSSDYFRSPTHVAPRRDSTLFLNGPALPFIHDRMPFPNCLDLPGFCQ
jgi:hypothetical protein